MIQSLTIQNFQSHEDTTLDFFPGVNIIIGSSDSGKTAIIRTLRWLIWNRPSGDAIRSNWGGETLVRLQTEEGSVTRSKDKLDRYILEINGKKNIEFKAFGTSVPEEISRFLNINEINLQQQLDSPFLLSETSGKVAEHWNKVAHLEKIDLATNNINSTIRELTSDIKYSEGQEKVLQEGLEKYSHLEKFEVDVEVLEEMDKQLIRTCSNHDKLGKLLQTYQKNKDSILEYKGTLELEKPVNDILDLIELRAEKDIEVVKLDKLIVQIKRVQTNIKEQRELTSIETLLLAILKLYEDREEIENKRKTLSVFLFNVDIICDKLNKAKVSYNTLHNKFEKEFPNKCPLCGTIIKK